VKEKYSTYRSLQLIRTVCFCLAAAGAFFLWTVHAAQAALSPADVTVTFEPDSVYVGERVRCTIAVRHSGTQQFTIEGIDRQSVRPMELVDSRQVDDKLPDNRSELRLQLELALFGSGRQQLPPFTVVARNASGRPVERLEVRPVESVFIKALTDSTLKDLRPVVPILKPVNPFLLALPAVALVVLVVVLLFLLFRRRTRTRGSHSDPAHAALQKLHALGKELSGGMSPVDCYESLSTIVREYLQKRHGFRAMEQVTQEIAGELNELRVGGSSTILRVLMQADLIKFADSRPDVEECRNSIRMLQELICNPGEQKKEAQPQS
jgi:hypothetical protein